MKNFLFLLLFLCTNLTGAFAISSSITGGPTTALCSGDRATYVGSVRTQEDNFFGVRGMDISISGATNTMVVNPNNAAVVCFPLDGNPNTIRCIDTNPDGGTFVGFNVTINVTWNQSGTLTVQALRPNLTVASTSTETVTLLPSTIGGIGIDGPTTLEVNSFSGSYSAVTTVSGNSLSDFNWTVPPGVQVFGGTQGQDILVIFNNPGTYQLSVTATVTASCGGGSALRGTGITITVTRSGRAPDDSNKAVDRSNSDFDELNLSEESDFVKGSKSGVLFPNPVIAGQAVQYQLPENIDFTEQLFVRVFNPQGILVHELQLRDQVTTIATDRLPPGVYYLQIQDKNYSDTQTFMVVE